MRNCHQKQAYSKINKRTKQNNLSIRHLWIHTSPIELGEFILLFQLLCIYGVQVLETLWVEVLAGLIVNDKVLWSS